MSDAADDVREVEELYRDTASMDEHIHYLKGELAKQAGKLSTVTAERDRLRKVLEKIVEEGHCPRPKFLDDEEKAYYSGKEMMADIAKSALAGGDPSTAPRAGGKP